MSTYRASIFKPVKCSQRNFNNLIWRKDVHASGRQQALFSHRSTQDPKGRNARVKVGFTHRQEADKLNTGNRVSISRCETVVEVMPPEKSWDLGTSSKIQVYSGIPPGLHCD